MRLTIPRDALEPALKLALGAADPKAELSPYARLQLVAYMAGRGKDTGTLSIAATDGDATLRVQVAAEVAAGGAAVVEAKPLHEAAKLLPKHGKVTLALEPAKPPAGPRLRLACDRASFRFESLDPADFPLISMSGSAAAFEIAGTELARAVHLCGPAVSTEDTRFYLNGIYVHEDEAGEIVFVATNGHKLVRVACEMPEEAAGLPAVILPRQALGTIAALAKSVAGEPLEVALSPTLARFVAGPLDYTTKLIDGTFPNYERVVPATWTSRVTVEAGALSLAIARARVVVEDKGRAVRFAIDAAPEPAEAGGEEITVSASGNHGEAVDTTPATLEGEILVAGFNGTYLRELLDLMPASQPAVLHFDGPGNPCRLTSEGLDGVTMVLMPMRLEGAAPTTAPDDLVPAEPEGAEA
jgi:DNA polymerase-3 subunit beta